MDNGKMRETTSGTPQGGVVSPLLMNIALHGLERYVIDTLTRREGKKSQKIIPTVIRYADDFVVLDEDLEVIEQAQNSSPNGCRTWGWN